MKRLLTGILLFFACCSHGQTINIAVVGHGYKNNEQALFLSDLQLGKTEFFLRPPLKQRQSQFAFLPLSWNNQLGCKRGNVWVGSACNTSQILAEVNSHNVAWDGILVLVKNHGGGGAEVGGQIAVVGMVPRDTETGGHIVHELGHALFGLLDQTGGIMSAAGGGFTLSTFTTAQQATINSRIDYEVGPFYAVPPFVHILSPPSNYVASTGGTLLVLAEISPEVVGVEVFWDGVSKGSQVAWARNPYCNSTDGARFWIGPLTPGNHELRVVGAGINGISESIINVTVQ